ncbi:dipeptidase PepV [Mycoplasmatota bacterium WC44]
MNFNIDNYKDDLIKDLQDLLRIKSVLTEFNPNNKFPFGDGIQEALEFMLDLGDGSGFNVMNIDNYAGYIEFGSGDSELGVLCHLDVVPEGDGWSVDPYSAEIKDGKIYARGTTDDKGPTIAAFYAMKMLKDAGFKPNKRIRMILGTDEETGWRGIDYYFKKEAMPEIGFAPDASFPLIYGEKGIHMFDCLGTEDSELISFDCGRRYNMVPDYAECELSIDLSTEFNEYLNDNGYEGNVESNKYSIKGVSAHAMQPHLGVNAGYILCKFLKKHINSKFVDFIVNYTDTEGLGLGIKYVSEEMGPLTLNMGIANLKNKEFKIGINTRVPIGWDMFKELEEKISELELKYDNKDYSPVHYVDKNDDLVKVLHKAYIKYTNDTETPLMTIGGGTYSRALKKAVAFGPMMPGRVDVAHQKDEYIHIEDLFTAVLIYAEAIMNLTS